MFNITVEDLRQVPSYSLTHLFNKFLGFLAHLICAKAHTGCAFVFLGFNQDTGFLALPLRAQSTEAGQSNE